MKLYTKITIGLVAGVLVGWLLNAMFNAAPFEAADKDKNEYLSMEEVLTSGEDFAKYRNAEAIAAFDKNQDGKLDFTEIIETRYENTRQGIESAVKSSDMDGNSQLSFNEVLVAGEALETWKNQNAFNTADTSGNGELSREEILHYQSNYTIPKISARFDVADQNHNQVLEMAELVAAKHQFRQFLDPETRKSADLNGDKLLTFDEVMLAGFDLEQFFNPNEFLKADKNGDHRISYDEEKSVSGWQRFTAYTDPIGKIFIRLVKLVVVPLVLASLILGAANLGDVKKLGKIGLKTFGFFTLTTAIAVTIGITSANLIRPGDGLPVETRDALVQQYEKETSSKVESVTTGPQKSELEKITDIFVKMVPTNPIEALATGDMLAIIFFAIFFGICLTLIPGDRAAGFLAVMDGLNEVVLKMVMLAMETAPYGVFALIVGVVAEMGVDILIPLAKYGLVVAGALFLHFLITHMSFIIFYLKKNPLQFLKAIKEAILLGFSTSSSSATLPISMNVATKNLGISNQVSSFVLPLGATINMDGTALYQGVAAIFIAQVYDMDLTFAQQAVMVLTATLASIGAAGVPGAGMITLAVVLGTAGIPVEGIALIFGLDRLLDMLRTTINIIGDITCTAVMAKSEGEQIIIYEDRDIISG